MRRMRAALVFFLRSRTGTTAIEYAIIGSVISIAIVAGAQATGVNLTAYFTKVATNLK
jgi:pilus assembly protein Flp/PilA